MATTYKIMHNAVSDGVAYIDLPISGRITSISFSTFVLAGAGGTAAWGVELSRVAVNQILVNNPRGVIGAAFVTTAAASQAKALNAVVFPDEPVKSGERLYLNAAYNPTANLSAQVCICFVTIA